MKNRKLKGIEGMPLKYIIVIIVGAIIIAVFLQIANIIGNTGLQGVSEANQTLTAVLNKSIGNAIS